MQFKSTVRRQVKRSYTKAATLVAAVAFAGSLGLAGSLAFVGTSGWVPAFAQTPAPSPAAKPAAGTAKVAKPTAPLLDINSASLAELDALKGIGEKRAADIVKGRPYKGKDDLVQKKIIPQSVYNGIKDQIIAKQK